MKYKEEWTDIISYEGLYKVSSLGNIKSRERTCKTLTGTRSVKEKILALAKSSNGYMTVGLSIDNISKTYQVHKLVYLHFINSDIPEGMQINHIDGNKANNRKTNLELTTPSENRKHAFRIGLQLKPFGELNPQTKLSTESLLSLKAKIKVGLKDKELASTFGLSHKYINDIRNGKRRVNE